MKRYVLILALFPMLLRGQVISKKELGLDINLTKIQNSKVKITVINNTKNAIYFNKNSLQIGMYSRTKNRSIDITKRWLNNERLNVKLDTLIEDRNDCMVVSKYEEKHFSAWNNRVKKELKAEKINDLENSLRDILQHCIFLKAGESYCESYSTVSLKDFRQKKIFFKVELLPKIYFQINQFGYELSRKLRKNQISTPQNFDSYRKLEFGSKQRLFL